MEVARLSFLSLFGRPYRSRIVGNMRVRIADRATARYFAHRHALQRRNFQPRESPHEVLVCPHAPQRILDIQLSLLRNDVAIIHDSQMYGRYAAQPQELQQLPSRSVAVPKRRIYVMRLIPVIILARSFLRRLVQIRESQRAIFVELLRNPRTALLMDSTFGNPRS